MVPLMSLAIPIVVSAVIVFVEMLGSDPKHNILRYSGVPSPSWQSAKPWLLPNVYDILENAVFWGLTPLDGG